MRVLIVALFVIFVLPAHTQVKASKPDQSFGDLGGKVVAPAAHKQTAPAKPRPAVTLTTAQMLYGLAEEIAIVQDQVNRLQSKVDDLPSPSTESPSAEAVDDVSTKVEDLADETKKLGDKLNDIDTDVRNLSSQADGFDAFKKAICSSLRTARGSLYDALYGGLFPVCPSF